ncbi:hypothetical protein [Defluviimonas sp. D31]|uniref:hypothetical protein n=1 Tax=Defluviimonas sp. D31 TaxID=3083253 RepID=UPI00296F7718|nr:hypothetical protein [Defluviimonas sp. D31]
MDPDCLVALYAELGEVGAERVLGRAMEELNARLTEMQRFVDEGRTAQLTRSARLLIKVAEQIGMPSFARVADDVVRATEAGDNAAQAATLARLIRIGDRSLNAVCDLRDLTV